MDVFVILNQGPRTRNKRTFSQGQRQMIREHLNERFEHSKSSFHFGFFSVCSKLGCVALDSMTWTVPSPFNLDYFHLRGKAGDNRHFWNDIRIQSHSQTKLEDRRVAMLKSLQVFDVLYDNRVMLSFSNNLLSRRFYLFSFLPFSPLLSSGGPRTKGKKSFPPM